MQKTQLLRHILHIARLFKTNLYENIKLNKKITRDENTYNSYAKNMLMRREKTEK